MNTVQQLFAYPFRIFFVSVAVWAVLSILFWGFQMNGLITLPLAHPALVWHRHELLFGILNPAIAGFLLTAVCVWTGTERMHGLPLALLWLVWLIGRLAATFGGPELATFSIAVNLAFLPLVALDAGHRIIVSRQWRQLMILAIIALLWLMQLGSLLTDEVAYTSGAMILLAALMLVVGGRITPTFSAKWLSMHGVDPAQVRTPPRLDFAMLIVLLALLIVTLLEHRLLVIVLALMGAAITFFRLWLWRGWLVHREPLLWILHWSLLWIPVALVLLAGHHALQWPNTAWQHALGIGAMGGLILGVMTRVSLGHTGRPLQLPSGMLAAYVCIQVAVVARLLMVFTIVPWRVGMIVAAVAWVVAFSLFLWRYLPILGSARVDGQPG